MKLPETNIQTPITELTMTESILPALPASCDIAVMSHLTQHPSAVIPLANESINESTDKSVDGFLILNSQRSPPENGSGAERPITPIIKHIASLHLPHDESEKSLLNWRPYLKLTLLAMFSTTNQIYSMSYSPTSPDEILPFQINEDLLHSLPSTVYDSTKHKWVLKNVNTEYVSKIFSLST